MKASVASAPEKKLPQATEIFSAQDFRSIIVFLADTVFFSQIQLRSVPSSEMEWNFSRLTAQGIIIILSGSTWKYFTICSLLNRKMVLILSAHLIDFISVSLSIVLVLK